MRLKPVWLAFLIAFWALVVQLLIITWLLLPTAKAAFITCLILVSAVAILVVSWPMVIAA